MLLRPFHIVLILALLPFFSCQKDLSYEGVPIPHQGTFTSEIDGVAWAAADSTKGASLLGGLINITGISADNRQLSITLQDTTIGVYTLNQGSVSIGAYADIDSSDIYAFSTNQGTDTAEAGGQVTITEIDKTNKTISGTFSFKVFRNIDGHQKHITQGIFYKLPYVNSLPVAPAADTLQASVDGSSWTAQSILETSISGQLVITGSTLSGIPSISLLFPVYLTPNTYTLSPNSPNPATVYVGLYNPSASVNLVSESGQLTILENDTVTGRLRGTFQFQAGNAPLSNQTAQISSGYFSVKLNP